MLPDSLLNDYCQRFFGFGTRNASVWFIGLEEGGGWEEADVKGRLNAWKINRRPLEDAPKFYRASECHQWHDDMATLQATWKQLIRMLLLGQGKDDADKAILDYQRERLGAFRDETCLLELLPLPSPNTKTWHYSKWSDLEWLKNRQAYEAKVILQRACAIKKAIEKYNPKVVVFYGSSRLRYWSQISGGYFEQAIEEKLMHFKSKKTMFFVTRHPSRETDKYFQEIGNYLRSHHGNRF